MIIGCRLLTVHAEESLWKNNGARHPSFAHRAGSWGNCSDYSSANNLRSLPAT